MKKSIYIRLICLLSLMTIPCILSAQFNYVGSSGRTSYTPIHIPKVTTEYVTNQNVGQGMTFTGQIYYSDGNFLRYEGCLTTANGDKYHGKFNAQMNVKDGDHILYVPAAGDYAYRKICRGGQFETVQTYNIQGRSYYVTGTTVSYADNGGGNYVAPSSGYSSGSSSSSSSGSHGALCRGCNGSGRCQHCGGTGWVNNHKSKCSLCHGSGRCVSCAGVGKVY